MGSCSIVYCARSGVTRLKAGLAFSPLTDLARRDSKQTGEESHGVHTTSLHKPLRLTNRVRHLVIRRPIPGVRVMSAATGDAARSEPIRRLEQVEAECGGPGMIQEL